MSYREHSESPYERERSWLSRIFGVTSQGTYIVGMIADVAEAEAATRELQEAASCPDDVVFLSADEVARRVRGDGSNPAAEILTERGSFCADYNERALGSALVSMYTQSGKDVVRAHRILAAHDAHAIVYFGDWTIRQLPRKPLADGSAPATNGRSADGASARLR